MYIMLKLKSVMRMCSVVNICRVSVLFFSIFKAVYHICNPLDPEMNSDLIGESVFKVDCSYQELGNGTVARSVFTSSL